MRAWTREISLSPPRLPSPGVERPITSSCSSAIDEPAALPATTLRDSPAIGGHLNNGCGRPESPGTEIRGVAGDGVRGAPPMGVSASPPVQVRQPLRWYAGEEKPPDQHPR